MKSLPPLEPAVQVILALNFTRKSIGQSQETPSSGQTLEFSVQFWQPPIRNDGDKMESRPLSGQTDEEAIVGSNEGVNAQCTFAARWEEEGQ